MTALVVFAMLAALSFTMAALWLLARAARVMAQLEDATGKE